MSIYATNYIVDELTGDKKLIKHLNKCRVHRFTCSIPPGGWNKSGKRSYLKGGNSSLAYCSKTQRKVQMKLNELIREQEQWT
jgi:hypothetical protein